MFRGMSAIILFMGTPRDITGGLTGWAERSPSPAPGERPPSRQPKKKKQKPPVSSAPSSSSVAARSTDYFSVFVYSLVVVSLLAQGVLMLALSVV